jgi:flagellar hook protein FlgE
MAGYEIGISGLHAAQKALDIIGNNIANAATEGRGLSSSGGRSPSGG